MKLRTSEPWMSGKAYGHSLRGLSLNLLVANIEAALSFQREVLTVTVIYDDPDFAVCSHAGCEWMLHADHTYESPPLRALAASGSPRGGGIEIRIHGRDRDGYVWVPDVQV